MTSRLQMPIAKSTTQDVNLECSAGKEVLSYDDLIVLFQSKELLEEIESTLEEGDEIFIVGGTASRFIIGTLDDYEKRSDIDIITSEERIKSDLLKIQSDNNDDEIVPELDVVNFIEYIQLYRDALTIGIEELRKTKNLNQDIEFYNKQAALMLELLDEEDIRSYLATAFLFKRESVAIRIQKVHSKLMANVIDDVNWHDESRFCFPEDRGIMNLYEHKKGSLGQINPLSIKLLLLMIGTKLPESTIINNPIMHSALDVPHRIIKEMAEESFETVLYGDAIDSLTYVYNSLQLFLQNKFPFKSGKGWEYEMEYFKKKFQRNISIACVHNPAIALYHALGVFPTGDILLPGLSEEFRHWTNIMGGDNNFLLKNEAIKMVSLFQIQSYFGNDAFNSMSDVFALLMVALDLDKRELDKSIHLIISNWTQTDENIGSWSKSQRNFSSKVTEFKLRESIKMMRSKITEVEEGFL